ncbi:MAG: uracil-DNA glycosylase [Aquabacterium sp.]|nr:uracil-DNA glycosylase [Aquabacterium sp.]
MRWTERQRAMLREIGIPAFWPVEAAPVDPADTVDAVVPPAPVSAPAPAQAPKASTSKTATPTAVAEAVLNPLPDGIDTMAWQPLRQAVSNCQACGLCHSRTQPVFGVGHEQADWMFVGEAPGELEDTQGEPFVDHAGQMLDRMLEAVGLMRTEGEPSRRVFITNVLKCRPPASRNPVAQEVDQCTPYLMRQIALVQPKVIVAMGRFAVQALLKSAEPIGKLRGQVHHVAGVPVVVTYHPAYLLRRPVDKALAWDDLCLAREILAKPAVDSSS